MGSQGVLAAGRLATPACVGSARQQGTRDGEAALLRLQACWLRALLGVLVGRRLLCWGQLHGTSMVLLALLLLRQVLLLLRQVLLLLLR